MSRNASPERLPISQHTYLRGFRVFSGHFTASNFQDAKTFNPRLVGAKRKSSAFEIAITWHNCNEIYRLNTYFGAQESVEFDLECFECARLQETIKNAFYISYPYIVPTFCAGGASRGPKWSGANEITTLPGRMPRVGYENAHKRKRSAPPRFFAS